MNIVYLKDHLRTRDRCRSFYNGNVHINYQIAGVLTSPTAVEAPDYDDYMINHSSPDFYISDMGVDVFTVESSEGWKFGIQGFILQFELLDTSEDEELRILGHEVLVPRVGHFGAETKYRSTGLLMAAGINRLIEDRISMHRYSKSLLKDTKLPNAVKGDSA